MAKDRCFMVREPLIQRKRGQGIPAGDRLDLVERPDCKALRPWMPVTEILKGNLLEALLQS